MANQINHKLVTVTIDKVGIEEKEWKGKPLWNVGVNFDSEWHNGTVWSEKDLEKFKEVVKEGQSATLMFYQEQVDNGLHNKFRVPYKSDFLQKTVDTLEMWKQDAINKYPDLKDMVVPE